MQFAVAGEEAVPLPGARETIDERFAVAAGDGAAGFGDQDVAGADVPVVESVVGVEIKVGLAARHQGQLDAGGMGFAHVESSPLTRSSWNFVLMKKSEKAETRYEMPSDRNGIALPRL